MDQMGERGVIARAGVAPAAPGTAALAPTKPAPAKPAPAKPVPTRVRRETPIHLPTWSRLNVAAKQSAPAGNGGDFFEVIQQRDGRVTVVMADVCGNGPSAAAPVSSLRWILRQTIARGGAGGPERMARRAADRRSFRDRGLCSDRRGDRPGRDRQRGAPRSLRE